MAASFQAKSSQVLGQQLKVQELCFRKEDLGLYSVSGSDIVIPIGETVSQVLLAIVKDDSVPGLVVVPAADVSLVDSSQSIQLASVTLAANDVVLLKYIVADGE